MPSGKLRWIPLTFCLLCVTAHGQEMKLEPGKTVEREIAGGESHAYQIQLAAKQFVRFRLDQRAIDAALTMTAPDGKQLVEMNLTRAGAHESLSMEAAAAGSYRLTVRGNGSGAQIGGYRLEAAVTAAVTPQDQQRLAAEALLLEAQPLANQGGTAQQALEKLQQALALWQELGDAFWSALSLQRSANAYNTLRQPEKALECLEKAAGLIRELKHRSLEALVLYSLGFTYQRKNQPDKAMAYFEQARAIYREVKDPYYEGQALMSLGSAANNLSRFEKAIEYNEQARAVFREVKDRLEEGRTLLNLGTSHNRLGRSDTAIEHFQQALVIFRELKNRLQERNAITSLGTAYGSQGQMEKAVEYFEQSLVISREVHDKEGEGRALSNLGLGYFFLSQYEKSIAYLDQALQLSRQTSDRTGEGATLSHLGASYANLGQTEKATAYHDQSLAIFREIKNRYMEGTALQNLWDAYASIGRHEKAIEFIEQAIAIFREVKYRVGEANALGALAVSYNQLGRYEESLARNEEALVIHREVKFRPGEAVTLQEMGLTHARLKRHEKALELYEQALAIYREVKNRHGVGMVVLKTGESKRQLGRLDEAATLFTESISIMRAIGKRDAEVEGLTALARLEGARGNLVQARTLIENSLQVAESLRSDLVSPESRTAFLATVQESYQLYTDLLMRQHKAEPQRGLDALAVETSERQRARSLLDLLSEADTNLRQGVDPALIERERTLAKQLNDKAQRLTQASTAEKAEALRKEISQLETDYERAQADIRKASPHYAALTQPQPLKLKEIQAQLDADTLLLEYALGEERSYLWAITRETLTSYELPKEEQITRSALQVHELLSARSTGYRGESALQRQERITRAEADLPAAARALSQILLAPAAPQLGNRRLVIVADGALQYIPFAMLPDPAASTPSAGSRSSVIGKNQPLVVNHEVVSLPSASALAIQRAELAGRRPAPKLLAVIADPVFDRTDARFTTTATEVNDKQPAQTIAFNDARSIEHLADKSNDKAGVTTRRLVIPRLPFTRQEATRLLALTPKSSSFSAMDFQANRAAALSGDLSQYRYVHFATHGLLDSERPGLSSLVLSMVDAEGKPQDGFLRANDIYNLKLPAELVVLSACQTGLGKEIKGEGLVGLTRGFMYAGAARVVVSLWSVNDKATADLMTKFYEKMLKQGERPAAALRAAQVEMWKQKQWQSPYYWAAFVLQGEWK